MWLRSLRRKDKKKIKSKLCSTKERDAWQARQIGTQVYRRRPCASIQGTRRFQHHKRRRQTWNFPRKEQGYAGRRHD